MENNNGTGMVRESKNEFTLAALSGMLFILGSIIPCLALAILASEYSYGPIGVGTKIVLAIILASIAGYLVLVYRNGRIIPFINSQTVKRMKWYYRSDRNDELTYWMLFLSWTALAGVYLLVLFMTIFFPSVFISFLHQSFGL